MSEFRGDEFHGIIPAIITPMDSAGRLNEEAMRQIFEFNLQAGVHGFWVAGGSGESVYLQQEENRRIAEIAVDQVKGRGVNIMHVGANTTPEAARLAEHAARTGVEAICCVPPFFYPPSDAEVVEHYRVVAAAADLPFFVYNLPSCTGIDITADLMKAIQDQVPQVVGVKHSSPLFTNVRTFAAMGLRVFIGSAILMLPALTLGAAGCVDGPPGFAPEAWVDVWKAYQSGDLRHAEEAQRRAMEIWSVMTKYAYFASLKAAVGIRLGIDTGDPLPPATPLTAEQFDDLRGMIAALNLADAAVS